MTDEEVPKTLRASLVRLFTSLYIDDHPHTLMKMSRCFQAYESAEVTYDDVGFKRSEELTSQDLNSLFVYINSYFYAFAKEAQGSSSVKAFEMELVKCCKFMLKFGIFTFRNNEFQIDDIDDLFSFLCHILDIFTNRKDYINLQSLDDIVQKDSIIQEYTQNNPIQKAAFDIKYRLLNKRDWANTASDTKISGEEGDTFRSANIHSKLVVEIMEIFHFLLDLRQGYLMANITEMFHKRVFTKHSGKRLMDSESEREKSMATMIKDFKRVLPDSNKFTQQMKYKFPSLDEMYENEEFEDYRKEVQNKHDNIDMHDEFLILLIDTFNVSSGDSFIQQITLTLICRYYSERSELVRNIERMTLVFDDDEWKFFNWVNYTIDQFTRCTEKSDLWLIDIEEFEEDDYIAQANQLLKDLRDALYHKYTITEDEHGKLSIKIKRGKERKINKFAQRVYRSLKIYDHLISFMNHNMKLLLYVRTCDDSVLGEKEADRVENIEKVFKKSLNILQGFCTNNKINQELMWKYRNFFLLPELGSSEEDGELELVLAIIDGNDLVARTRSLKVFIQNLNKRMGHASNFVVLLDIFNKLMDFETGGSIKRSLIKLILKQDEKLRSTEASNAAEFEAAINVKEILLHILTNQELSYTKDSFKGLFPLDEFLDRLNGSLMVLDELEKNEEDEEYDEQEYEEMRESQQKVLIELYSILHFNKEDSSLDIDKVIGFFNDSIAPDYEERLDRFIDEINFDDTESYKLSEIKLLVLHYQILIKNIRQFADMVYEKQLSRSGRSSSMMPSVQHSQELADTIQAKVGTLLEKLKHCQHDDVKDLMAQILGKEDDEEGDGSLRASSRPDNSNRNGSHTNLSVKLSEIVKHAVKKGKSSSNMKMKNRRTKDAIGYGKAWAHYVDIISKSRYVRELNNNEQNDVANYVYDVLTKKPENESDSLNVYSLKKFIVNSIDFACDCEKQTWTVYLVIFVFKLHANILKKCETDLTDTEELTEALKYKITKNILEIMDTLRNSNYVFSVLSESDPTNLFADETFMIIMYYINKLLSVRTGSVQKKFEGLFLNNSGCQSFFSKLDAYLKVTSDKIGKGILKEFFKTQRYTDELSPKSYYVDKNLEKQIMDFIRQLCKNDNTFMQNYMKKQHNNSRSFNLVYSVNEFSKMFMDHLHYPVAFDTFSSCLMCLLEFIQGPNKTNQNILILNEFVSHIAKPILMLKYHEKQDTAMNIEAGGKENISTHGSVGGSVGGSITFNKSHTLAPSITIGKSASSKQKVEVV